MFLAWRNLIHDRVRLLVTLTGIVFAIVLIVVQVGLFLGFHETSANIIEYSGADLWVMATGTPHLNGATPLDERKLWQILGTPGVATAQRYIVTFVYWKLPSGASESVQVVGFDVESELGGPWNVTRGSIDDLHTQDTVLVDELYMDKLGVTGTGHATEMSGRRARVVGMTRGIRSFTTAPYVYTAYKNAQDYAGLPANQTFFFLVKAEPGVDLQALKERLRRRVSGVDVHINDEFLWATRNYWVLSTGAGVTTLIGAVLGLIVGVVVVAQTIYAATVDHIREFGTLKAMGANNAYIYRVIIHQALLSACMGYLVAIAIAYFVARSSENGEAIIMLPPELAVGMFGVAVLMCVGASVLSIRKATTIDPAMVFKG
jgi:putative ABC transport system permease protein